ncbi:MAG: serine/threonine protein kinase [Candidatus Margulisbacteria bacterium]|nr:serine/threonine protein kinase [Candidatus Margulisiibacteriota bacterium]
MTTQSIWQPLNHDTILNAVEKTLQKKVSNLLLPRNSYINRVYELEEHDNRERFIVKFYRPGRWTPEMILEEHQFLNELHEREVPVIPPMTINGKTLFELNSILYALFPKKGGRALDEFDKDTWLELGRLIARIHITGAKHQKSNRITWRPDIATKHHLDVLYSTNYLLPEFKSSFDNIAAQFMRKASPKFDGQEFLLLHGDCHKGNLIHRPNEGIFIVDFDDICFGPPVQDLWLLLPDKPENCEKEMGWLISGYELFRDFPRRSLELIPLLQGMRIIHYVSWLAIQSKEADFEKHFPHAGTKRYWNELIKELQEIVYGV